MSGWGGTKPQTDRRATWYVFLHVWPWLKYVPYISFVILIKNLFSKEADITAVNWYKPGALPCHLKIIPYVKVHYLLSKSACKLSTDLLWIGLCKFSTLRLVCLLYSQPFPTQMRKPMKSLMTSIYWPSSSLQHF